MNTLASTPSKIRLFLAEDDASVRQGYISMLEDEADIEILGEAGDARTAIEATLRLRPDVILMDLGMPGETEESIGGIEAVTQVCSQWPEAKVVILTNHSGDELIYQSIRKGAIGYLLKRRPFEEVLMAIRTVAKGKTYMSDEVLDELRKRIFKDGIDQLLNDKEIALIRLAAKGIELEEAANILNISVSSAKSRWASILSKLGSKGRVQAITNARERGFI